MKASQSPRRQAQDVRCPPVAPQPCLPLQPVTNHNPWMLLYFISFLLIVSFFVLNMFVGVVVENFHKCRQHQEAEEARRREEKRRRHLEKQRRSKTPVGQGQPARPSSPPWWLCTARATWLRTCHLRAGGPLPRAVRCPLCSHSGVSLSFQAPTPAQVPARPACMPQPVASALRCCCMGAGSRPGRGPGQDKGCGRPAGVHTAARALCVLCPQAWGCLCCPATRRWHLHVGWEEEGQG